jgi:CDP-diacylglycerol--serine O-phosphatidyltransferase
MPTAASPRPQHFSMIRSFHLADLFTLANAGFGMAAVLLTLRYMDEPSLAHFLLAAAMAPAALIADVLDGTVARARHTHSAMGRELDSLADIVSFGVAPAALGYAAGLRGGWDLLALVFFVCCGVSRLARFNVTAEQLSGGGDKVRYFEGMPIPSSVLLTAVLALAAWQGRVGEALWGGSWQLGPWALHPLALMYLVAGSLMVSKTLHIPKL